MCVMTNTGAINGTPLPVLPNFDVADKAMSKEEELLRERKRLTTTGECSDVCYHSCVCGTRRSDTNHEECAGLSFDFFWCRHHRLSIRC